MSIYRIKLTTVVPSSDQSVQAMKDLERVAAWCHLPVSFTPPIRQFSRKPRQIFLGGTLYIVSHDQYLKFETALVALGRFLEAPVTVTLQGPDGEEVLELGPDAPYGSAQSAHVTEELETTLRRLQPADLVKVRARVESLARTVAAEPFITSVLGNSHAPSDQSCEADRDQGR